MKNKRALLYPKVLKIRLVLVLFCCQGLSCGGKTKLTPQKNQPVVIQDKQIDEKRVSQQKAPQQKAPQKKAPQKKVPQKKESDKDSQQVKPVQTIDPIDHDEEHSKEDSLSSLSSHETIAVLKGFIRTGFCNGRTARCGDRTCSHYKLHAHFQIEKYEKFKKMHLQAKRNNILSLLY